MSAQVTMTPRRQARQHTLVSPAQRMQLRALLHELWREHLDELTGLSVHAHSPGSPAGVGQDAVDARLWELRRALVEIESAIKRLDTGSYGRCDGCDTHIDFTILRRRPHRRFCARCERRAAAA